MKNKRWQNIALGLAFTLPVLGVYVGRKLLARGKNKSSGVLPEVTRIRIPLTSLIGIHDNEVSVQPQQPKIVLPDADEGIVNHVDEPSSEVVNILYIASTERGKFHKSDCRWAENIKPENKIILNARTDALDRGYTPCSTCNP